MLNSTVLAAKARAVAVTFSALLCAPAVDAQNERIQERTRDVGRSDQSAQRTELQWLQAIQNAALRLNYSGTVVYQQNDIVRATRVVHFFDGSKAHERLIPLDGVRREYVRRGEEVQCLIPDAKRVIVEQRPTDENFPAIGFVSPNEVLERYRLRLGGTERVADYECRVIHVTPKDWLRYGYRLCVEQLSGLLLKAQTINRRKEVVEQIAFTDVKLNERFDAARLKPSWTTDGWRVERSVMQPANIAQAGWTVTAPDGFRKRNEVVRRMGPANGRPAMQVVFSDGLATVSVFIEVGQRGPLAPNTLNTPSASSGLAAPATGDAASNSEPGNAAPAAQSAVSPAVSPSSSGNGPTSVYVRRVGDALVTVVGEVPPETVKAVADSVAVSSRAGGSAGNTAGSER